jgi:Domain of unknown function (DUF4149)
MNLMERLRLIVVSILFAGSAAIVFAAITLVKAAVKDGLTVSQAAAANAPIFVGFSNVVLVASLVLVVCEWGHFRRTKQPGRIDYARYVASFLCFVCTIIFSLALIPNMESLRPTMKNDTAAFQDFTRLHNVSRMVFGGTILFALLSLGLTDLPYKKKD